MFLAQVSEDRTKTTLKAEKERYKFKPRKSLLPEFSIAEAVSEERQLEGKKPSSKKKKPTAHFYARLNNAEERLFRRSIEMSLSTLRPKRRIKPIVEDDAEGDLQTDSPNFVRPATPAAKRTRTATATTDSTAPTIQSMVIQSIQTAPSEKHQEGNDDELDESDLLEADFAGEVDDADLQMFTRPNVQSGYQPPPERSPVPYIDLREIAFDAQFSPFDYGDKEDEKKETLHVCGICNGPLKKGVAQETGKDYMFCPEETCCVAWTAPEKTPVFHELMLQRLLPMFKRPAPPIRCNQHHQTCVYKWGACSKDKKFHNHVFLLCNVKRKDGFGPKCGFTVCATEPDKAKNKELSRAFYNDQSKRRQDQDAALQRADMRRTEAKRDYQYGTGYFVNKNNVA